MASIRFVKINRRKYRADVSFVDTYTTPVPTDAKASFVLKKRFVEILLEETSQEGEPMPDDTNDFTVEPATNDLCVDMAITFLNIGKQVATAF